MAAGNLRSTKDEVLEYVAQATQRLDGKDMARYTAQDIGYQLSISRNLASQYLNELAAQGLVVKVVTRPVYFIHRRTAERKYGCKLPQESFKSVEELARFCTGNGIDTIITADFNEPAATVRLQGGGTRGIRLCLKLSKLRARRQAPRACKRALCDLL